MLRRSACPHRDVFSRQPPPGDANDLLDQLVVAEAGRPRGLGKARVHRGIGDDSGQGVELENVRHAEAIDADVDATPVAATECLVGVEGGALDLGVQARSEEHTSELQSLRHLVCRLLLEKKKKEERTKNRQIVQTEPQIESD